MLTYQFNFDDEQTIPLVTKTIMEMKKLILIASLLTAGISPAQDQKTAAWMEDPDYLVQRIEIMHPDPYAFFPRE